MILLPASAIQFYSNSFSAHVTENLSVNLGKCGREERCFILLMRQNKSSKNPPQGIVLRNLIIVHTIYLFSQY